MDWNAAIEKNREALKRVLAMLVAMAGLSAPASPLRERMVRLGEERPSRQPNLVRGVFRRLPPCPAVSTAPCSLSCVRPRRRCGG